MLMIISIGLNTYIFMFSPFVSFLNKDHALFALKAPTNFRVFLHLSLLITQDLCSFYVFQYHCMCKLKYHEILCFCREKFEFFNELVHSLLLKNVARPMHFLFDS